MELLRKIFGGISENHGEVELDWKILNSSEQVNALIENSKIKPQVIFKHSTRCGISRIVLKEFERDNKEFDGFFDFYFNDLIKYRDVSNLIASQFKVRHESPQLIVIKNGEVILYSSHGSINTLDLKALIH